MWRVQMQKPISVIIFSGSYVYVELFHFNGNENNLFIAIKVKLLKPTHRSLRKMLILEDNFKQH